MPIGIANRSEPFRLCKKRSLQTAAAPHPKVPSYGTVELGPMSDSGQTRRFNPLPMTSGLPQTTDIAEPGRLVRFVPETAMSLTKPSRWGDRGLLAHLTQPRTRQSCDPACGARYRAETL